jgi:hypothetical protein
LVKKKIGDFFSSREFMSSSLLVKFFSQLSLPLVKENSLLVKLSRAGGRCHARRAAPTMQIVVKMPGLIERGLCTFQEKAARAMGAGAIGIIFANSEDELYQPLASVGPSEPPFCASPAATVSISADVGVPCTG